MQDKKGVFMTVDREEIESVLQMGTRILLEYCI